MSTAPADATTVRQFLELLATADLVSKDDLAAVKAKWSEAQMSADANELARGLVQLGKLTKYQAASVYQRRPKSLGIASYIFLDRLGTGGSGSVYKAKHRKTGDIVAVKVLNLHGSRSADALKRFQREAETAARLQHPNLVRALETGESGGQYYTVMELVEGIDLSTYVKKQGPLPFEQATHCILETARALAYAHDQGVIHRDIKPANLMLSAGGKIKVLDMGLARLQDPGAEGNDQAAEGLTQTGQVMGTVDYMAPEQALHTRHADARADVYSLGCTFYRLATGDIPFDGDSMVAKILAHREKPIPSIRARHPKAPPAVDVVLQRMLAKKPEDRYQSMKELADDLVRCLEGREIIPLKQPILPVAAAIDGDSRSNTFTLATPGQAAATYAGEGAYHPKSTRSKGVPVWAYAVCAVAVLGAVGGGIAWKKNHDAAIALDDPPIEEVALIPPVVKPVSTASPTSTAANNATSSLTVGLAANLTNTAKTAASDVATLPLTGEPPSPERTARQRALSTWCIERGFSVNVTQILGSKSLRLRELSELPDDDFLIMSIAARGATTISADDMARLAEEPEIMGFQFNDARIAPEAIDRLRSFPQLHMLALNRTNLGDAELARLPEFKRLRLLELGHTKVTDAGLASLAQWRRLQQISLQNLPITDAGLEQLRSLPSIKSLDLGATNITDAAVATLSGFKNLKWLNLQGTQVTSIGRSQLAAALPQCVFDSGPRLTTMVGGASDRRMFASESTINILDPSAVGLAASSTSAVTTTNGTNTTNTSVSPPVTTTTAGSVTTALPAGTNIIAQERAFTAWCLQRGLGVDVRDYDTNFSSRSVRSPDQMPTGVFAVTGLYCASSVPISHDLLVQASGGQYVVSLVISGCRTIELDSFRALRSYPRLEQLHLSRSAFTNADVDTLRSLFGLRTLFVDDTELTDAALDAVADLGQLEHLNLTRLAITDAAVTKLTRLSNLRQLNLDGTKITDASIADLSRLTNLQKLIIRNTAITAAGREQLTAALPGCRIDGPWTFYAKRAPSRDALGPLPDPGVTATYVPPSTGGAVATNASTNAATSVAPSDATADANSEIKKLPAPKADELEAALKLIRDELFKDDYATAKKPEERVALGQKLLAQASGLRDDPAGRYVVLREACELGAEGGDVNLAYSAASTAEYTYEVDALEWLAEACEKAQKKVQARPVCKATAEGLLPKVNDAVRDTEFAVAERLMNAALNSARKAQDAAVLKQLVDRDKLFDVEKRRFDEVTKARETLAGAPDDPAANLTLGKYVCFAEGKWEDGLKLLAKGSDPALKDLAAKSVPIPTALDDLAALGDLWWAKGEKAPKVAQTNLLLGALHWYELAAPQAAGLVKSKIDKRVADARTALGDLAPPIATSTSMAGTSTFPTPFQPPSTVTGPPPVMTPDAAGMKAFVSWVYSRNGYLYIRYPTGSRICYAENELANYPSFTIIAIRFRSSRNAILNDADIQFLSTLPWITQLCFDRMPLTGAHVAQLANLPALQDLDLVNCSNIGDAGIAPLAKATALTRLTMSSTGITDAALTTIGRLQNLQSLYLASCRITDAGLSQLQGLGRLNFLSLERTAVTDAGLGNLRGLMSLSSLYMSGTKVTGQGLAALQATNISYVSASDTSFNDAGAAAAATMPRLSSLYISNTAITDAGIARLANSNLSSLDVSGCRITDASAQTFARMPRLSSLTVRRTQMSPAAIQAIQTQNPRVRIYAN